MLSQQVSVEVEDIDLLTSLDLPLKREPVRDVPPTSDVEPAIDREPAVVLFAVHLPFARLSIRLAAGFEPEFASTQDATIDVLPK